jgi:hypothetical protein
LGETITVHGVGQRTELAWAVAFAGGNGSQSAGCNPATRAGTCIGEIGISDRPPASYVWPEARCLLSTIAKVERVLLSLLGAPKQPFRIVIAGMAACTYRAHDGAPPDTKALFVRTLGMGAWHGVLRRDRRCPALRQAQLRRARCGTHAKPHSAVRRPVKGRQTCVEPSSGTPTKPRRCKLPLLSTQSFA